MDIGIVASRYAKALLRFASDNQEEAQVYAEMQQLDQNFRGAHQMKSILNSPVLSEPQKIDLLCAAATAKGAHRVSQSTARFIELVVNKKRADLFHFIATAFQHRYEMKNHMISAHLTVATPISSDIQRRMQTLLAKRTNSDVHINVKINPALQAGFILEYKDYRMDASLRGQFEHLRRKLK